jgi:photosystem II stability/assembly factor-like uncharacterized protein
MRKFFVLLSVLMVAVLIIGTYMYEKQAPVMLPQQSQPNVEVERQPEVEELQPVNKETISYTLQKEELNITYNRGKDWIEVPIDKHLLFQGEYQGNEETLIDDSYILTEGCTAFLYAKDISTGAQEILLKYTHDQGETWQDSVITDSFPPMRFRKADFLNASFGYVILSGDRTMSQEYSIVYLTHDGGETWEATTDPPATRLIAAGGFVDEQTGFLSYGTINPEQPEVYVTRDGGDTWNEADFQMPEKYRPVFVQAEVPVREGDHLSVLVNQGPNGDYEGGKIKGKFLSEDNGLTWDFSMEVDPDEKERE